MYYELYVDVIFYGEFYNGCDSFDSSEEITCLSGGVWKGFCRSSNWSRDDMYCNCHIQENTGIKICSISWSH